ncbi:DUF302 domain-containing protein [Euzebya pacifica]|jgi:uncharacterized protein (DUF302 family)|uniref:DUF302 domain-containing protein n=1 Tax=Euzebya pacifica TaxID=1608957 RepID=UPI0030F9C241
MPQYTFTSRIDAEPAEAERRIRQALGEEGFGILTEIDVQATLKQKLDLDMRPYTILGACNPPLAHQAIEADQDIGALLPCNVIVRAHPDGGSELVAADPEAMLAVSPHADDLRQIASEAKQGIQRAFDAAARV